MIIVHCDLGLLLGRYDLLEVARRSKERRFVTLVLCCFLVDLILLEEDVPECRFLREFHVYSFLFCSVLFVLCLAFCFHS